MKNILWILVFCWMLVGIHLPAESAPPWKGMDVVRYCTGDTVLFADSTCRAYIQGMIDMHQLVSAGNKSSKRFCVPENEEQRDKGERMVPKWLAAFPEKLNQPPGELILQALTAIFPCRGN
jgi:hypothetical protein